MSRRTPRAARRAGTRPLVGPDSKLAKIEMFRSTLAPRCAQRKCISTRGYRTGCAPGDKICDRRARQHHYRTMHAAHLREKLEKKLEDDIAAATAPATPPADSPENDTEEAYYADAELGAALDRDLAAAWGPGATMAHAPPPRAM